ncbi:MAG: hypothetical protein QW279_03220 [Candidatus Jordarchaeaceae archaeon]
MEILQASTGKEANSPLRCPICGGAIRECAVDSINLQFLEDCLKEGKINAALSLARIVWLNIPQLRLTADSKAIIEGVSETMRQDLQKRVNEVLRPIEMFTKSFPVLIEKLPEDVRMDLQKEFKEAKARLEEEFRLLRESVPTFNNLIDALNTISENIENVTKKEIEHFKQDLNNKFKETLQRMGFPEPEQMRLLAQLVPSVLPLLHELLRFQKVPVEKGERGELELVEELSEYFPEDEYVRLGVSGDTDILAEPRFNGISLGGRVLIESKENHSGWSRSFLEQVRRHMKVRGERLAILAVEVMPSGANGFMVEPCSEGVVLVTSRDNFRVAYGALKAVFIALQPFNVQKVDIKKILADKKIEEAITEAFQYSEYLKNIRKRAQKIINNAKGIAQNVDDLDNCLKQCLKRLQERIVNAVHEI